MAESIKDCNEASNIMSESTEETTSDNLNEISPKTSNIENKAVAENTWWSSWMSSAKSKSVTVFEAVKRDLDEISSVVRSEVSNAGSMIGESLKLDEPESTANTVKKSISTFFGQVSEVLVPTIEDDDTEAVLITSDGVITLSGFQKHLAELQSNDQTYLSAPDEKLIDNYQRWLEVIEQDQFTQNQLAKHLSSSEILNEKYLKLVPDQISHMEFWKRYLFKRALLEDALAHAELAERRAKAEVQSTRTVSPKYAGEIIQTEQPKAVRGEDVANDEHDGNDEHDEIDQTDDILKVTDELIAADGDIKWEAELSEEQQSRLFAEYEAEMLERERREKRKNQNISLEDNKANQANCKNQKSRSKKSNANNGKSISKLDEAKGKTAQKPLTATKTSTSKSDSSPTESTQSPRSQEKQSIDGNVSSERKKRIEVTKADAESASDESWEKDFDLSDN